MSPNKILVVRHGESTWNVLRRQHTQEADRYLPIMYIPDAPMTELGIAQSRQAGIDLFEEIDKDDEHYVIVVSPLRRALQTTTFFYRLSHDHRVASSSARKLRKSCWMRVTLDPRPWRNSKWSFPHLTLTVSTMMTFGGPFTDPHNKLGIV